MIAKKRMGVGGLAFSAIVVATTSGAIDRRVEGLYKNVALVVPAAVTNPDGTVTDGYTEAIILVDPPLGATGLVGWKFKVGGGDALDRRVRATVDLFGDHALDDGYQPVDDVHVLDFWTYRNLTLRNDTSVGQAVFLPAGTYYEPAGNALLFTAINREPTPAVLRGVATLYFVMP